MFMVLKLFHVGASRATKATQQDPLQKDWAYIVKDIDLWKDMLTSAMD